MAGTATRGPQTPRTYPLTGRFLLGPAPAGLRLVQDLVNTALAEPIAEHRPDLLVDLTGAGAWLDEALEQWSAAAGQRAPQITLADKDLPALRDLRERLRATLRASADNAQPAAVAVAAPDGCAVAARLDLVLTPGGRVEYGPADPGWRAAAALVAAEALLAQATGAWSRLKTCAHPPCGICFYDSSPNRSRVWHDTKTCGNVNNLRASRTRRRADG